MGFGVELLVDGVAVRNELRTGSSTNNGRPLLCSALLMLGREKQRVHNFQGL
jgi:hypothetical protein